MTNAKTHSWESAIQALLDHKEASSGDSTTRFYKSNLNGIRK